MGSVSGMASLATGAALLALSAPPTANAQDEGGETACWVADTLGFDAGSSALNLDAQSKANEALQWLTASPGRYLMILSADGPRASDVRLGAVRASAVIGFLVGSGALPSTLARGDFRDLVPLRVYTRTNVDSVVLLACDESSPVP
jgi:outer membrane protein OmpA-like peptidoglycan-associated protein